jgi:restriction endonuclease Mrr
MSSHAGQDYTPFSPQEFDALLLEVLRGFGGKAHKQEAEKEAFRRKEAVFSQAHWQEIVGAGIPRWQHALQWAWDRAKRLGLGEPLERSARGIWQLTPKGLGSGTR